MERGTRRRPISLVLAPAAPQNRPVLRFIETIPVPTGASRTAGWGIDIVYISGKGLPAWFSCPSGRFGAPLSGAAPPTREMSTSRFPTPSGGDVEFWDVRDEAEQHVKSAFLRLYDAERIHGRAVDEMPHGGHREEKQRQCITVLHLLLSVTRPLFAAK
ncbi:hypothetical protein K438DRAFT_1964482 [Mycena galopus ATCC 62051]|nr:hypothetical protein K438DRAFT_1964482 [Mycena galopus ATCC 62051]